MPTLYVGFDVFFPGVYDPEATNPSGSFYIVLQPVIFEGTDPDAIALGTYLGYSGADLGRTIDVKPLTSDVANRLKNVNSGGLPVPFPPETTIQFKKISWDGIAAPIQVPANGSARIIGGRSTSDSPFDSPFMLKRDEWPHFAVADNMSPNIESWEKLDPAAQQPIALGWIGAAAGRILHKNNVEKKQLSPLESNVYSLLVAGGLDGTKPLSDDAIRAILLQNTAALAAKIYDLCITAGDKNYQPQRFPYTELQLEKDQTPLLGDLEDGQHQINSLSYHYRLWHSFLQKLTDLEKKKPHDATAAAPVRLALKRLFGFGERLYWPRQDDESFMRCDDVKDSKGWICTNAHSLLGHSFGFALPLDSKLQNFSVDLEVQGNTISASPLVNGMVAGATQTGMLQSAQNALVDWYGAHPRQKIVAGLAPDPDPNFSAGFFLFQPKMSASTKDTISDSSKTAYAMPSVLLDAIDPVARWEQPSDGSQMTRTSSPRIGLLRTEIYKGKALLPDTGGLYTPYLRIRVALKRIGVPFESTGDAYEVVPAMPPSLFETTAITALFKNILNLVSGASTAKPAPTLLIAQPNQAPATWTITTDRLVQPYLTLPEMTFALADVDNSLTKLVNTSSFSPSSPAGSTHVTCDLLLALDPKDTDATPFNLLVLGSATDDVGPMIILDAVFTSKLNRSTDRLQERVGISLSPWPSDPSSPQQYVAGHLTNFNLLRMSLSSSDSAVVALTPDDDPDEAIIVKGSQPKAIFPLTITDAILPLPPAAAARIPSPPPWKFAWPANGQPPQFGYFLSHIFTQDMRGSGGAEALRYVNYLTPQIEWSLEGGVAHQYGQILPVSEPSALTLPLTTDISHPGLTARSDIKADPSKPRSSLLTWRFAADSSNMLQLVFPTDFLRIVNDDGGQSGGDKAGALSSSPTRYRAIYEPLADFLSCLDNTDIEMRVTPPRAVPGLTLQMEGWVFDGSVAADARLNPDISIDEPPPVFIGNTRLLGAAELVITPAILAIQASNGPQLQALRNLINQSFDKFIAQIMTYAKANASDWAVLNVPLDSWTLDGAKLDPENLLASADLVRLGLTLIRPKASVAPALTAGTIGFGMGASDSNRAARRMELKTRSARLLSTIDDFSDLEPAAAQELTRYLDDEPGKASVLRRRFAWLRHRDGGMTLVTAPRSGTPAVSVATLVGDVAPFVTGRTTPLPDTDTVLTLYYVPVAFRPLAPDARVGDTAAVEEFVAFLLGIVSDIMAGNGLSAVQISDAAPADIGKFYNLRQRVLALYRNGANAVSTVLTGLLDYVEWKDSSNAKLLWVRDQADRTLSGPDGGWKGAIEILLDQTPNLYATVQGFAIALVDPDSWIDGLMSLQVVKTVPGLDSSGTGQVENNSIVDRVVFTRIHGRKTAPFFIDTFDTARYHEEFWIDGNTYTPSTPTPQLTPVKFSSGFSLLGRGGAEARTADDFLRALNLFDNPLVTGLTGSPRRSLEAEVVWYNTVWRQSEKNQPANRGIYLLPARQFPDSPTVMIPVGSSPNDDNTPVWRTAMNLSFSQGTPPNLTDLYWSSLTAQVLTPTVTFAGATSKTTIVASLPQDSYPPTKPTENQVPAGWWFLDTYATHHHFHVTPDSSDPTFKRDSFRIEVQRSDAPFTLDPETPGASTPVAAAGLLAWFQYQRLLAHDRSTSGQTPPGSIKAPDPISSDTLLTELGKWLSAGNGVLNPLDVKPVPTTRPVFTYVPSAEGAPTLHRPTSSPPGIGDVIAVDMLKLGDATGAFVLRVIVLDDAWKYSRVRVTHLRNETTIGGSPEFAPAFAMESPVSSWSAFGHQPMTVDFTSADLQQRNLPQGVASLRAGMKVSEYLQATQPVSYVPALSNACLATFKSASGKSWTMWNSNQVNSASFTVRGTLLHERLDLHPRFRLASGHTNPAAPIPERNEDVPRQFLPAGADVTADKIDDLVKNSIRRELVPGVHQKLRVVWHNANGEDIVTVTWPVMFDV
jgi:hypothetical protein